MPERATLYFPLPKRRGLAGVAVYQRLPVFLCGQRNCQLCNVNLREQLKGWQGGKLEVELELFQRPSLFKPQLFYSGHLLSIVEREKVDDGGEVDVRVLNTICLKTNRGVIVIDPGWMGFNGDFSLASLLGKEKVIGTVISHGHQDHWNLLGQMSGPVYLGDLTAWLIGRHLASAWNPPLARVRHQMRIIEPGRRLVFNSVGIQTFLLPHAIPKTMGMDIKGSKKRVVYLGDFRLSGWDWGTRAETIALLKSIADQGEVDVLALNIINVHLEGFTPSEGLIIEALTNVLMRAPGRVIVTCFSTNLARIKRIIEVAGILGRSAGFLGAGMTKVSELLDIKRNNDRKTVLFVTGCQAEEWSVLWRISKGEPSPLSLQANDTLVFSSRCIPGNEDNLRRLITDLLPKAGGIIVNTGETRQLGLEGLGVKETLTHVSGHASREDLRTALEILRPKQVLAWPQISPQMEAFSGLANPLGIEIIPETERVIEI